jgi:hypothetical protein
MYLKLTNGTPAKYTLGQLRRDNPQTSFPKQIPDEMLATYDVYSCTRLERPAYDHLTEQCFDNGFEQDAEGNWVQGYSVEPVEKEVAERNIREHRDGLLQETDWMALSDNTMTPEWATYRQALRDITSQEGFPYSVTWPTKP